MMKGLASSRHAARKAMAHMILGGVFDRFPALKVMLIESPRRLGAGHRRSPRLASGRGEVPAPASPRRVLPTELVGRAKLAAADRSGVAPRDRNRPLAV